jgi:hypothetical protein
VAHVDQDAVVAAVLLHRGGGLVGLHLDADDQPVSADLLDLRALDGLQVLHPAGSQVAGVLHQLVLLHDVYDGASGCGYQRVASEGRPVGAGGHDLGDLLGGRHGADGGASAQGLRHGDYVGHHAEVLDAEPLPGAPDAGLHLVDDHERSLVVALVADGLEELLRCGAHAALALDGLDYDGCDVLPDHALDGLGVPVLVVLERLADQGLEGVLVLLLAGGPQRGGRAAVEPVQGGHDLLLAGVAHGELQGALVGLSTAVDEQGAVEAPGGDGSDLLGEARLLLHVVEVRDVHHLRDLVLDRLHPSGVGVSQGVHGDARDEVEVLVALGVVQVASLPVGERQLYAAVVLEQVFRAQLFDFLEFHSITS